MKPLITALVDTYNHERYIEQALGSVLEQGLSEKELEIVVVDDGSTDRTAEIVGKFGPRVKCVRKKNGGQASAFNAAFPETHGEIVALLDGDDWWARGKLGKVIEALERNPEVAAVGHGYYEYHEDTKEAKACAPGKRQVLGLGTPEAAQAAGMAWRYVLMGALTARRKVLEAAIPIPEKMVFSADSAIQVAAMAMGTLVLPEPLFYYRYHAENLYAIDAENAAKTRRKYEMVEVWCIEAERSLLRLGVGEECVSALLDDYWVRINRLNLSRFGGSRWKTLRTEMRFFHAATRNPGIAYRAYKYVVMGAATLLLPPKRFYGLRDWYAREGLGRYRDWFCKADARAEGRTGPR